MQQRGFKTLVLLAGILFLGWASASAQQAQPRSQKPGSSAEGTLAVTATVVSSTGVVIGPDGEQHVIVANAADQKDSASPVPAEPPTKRVTLSPLPGQQPDSKAEPAKPQKP